MKSRKFRQLVAEAIYRGIVNFYSRDSRESSQIAVRSSQ
jgi:hypothetical protein